MVTKFIEKRDYMCIIGLTCKLSNAQKIGSMHERILIIDWMLNGKHIFKNYSKDLLLALKPIEFPIDFEEPKIKKNQDDW